MPDADGVTDADLLALALETAREAGRLVRVDA